MHLTAVLQGFTLLVLLGLPLLAVDEERLGAELGETIDRRSVYVSGGITLAVLGAVTLGVAAWQDVPLSEIGWRSDAPAAELAWGTGAAVAGLAMVGVASRIFERLGFRESPLALFLMPRSGPEKRDFLALVAVGAVCEELVYRGLALHVLAAWGGSAWMAVGVTAVSFGLAHGYQRFAGIVRATILGVLLGAPVVWTGSLVPAVAGHFAINVAIGLGGWRHLVAVPEEPEEPERPGGPPE